MVALSENGQEISRSFAGVFHEELKAFAQRRIIWRHPVPTVVILNEESEKTHQLFLWPWRDARKLLGQEEFQPPNEGSSVKPRLSQEFLWNLFSVAYDEICLSIGKIAAQLPASWRYTSA